MFTEQFKKQVIEVLASMVEAELGFFQVKFK